MSTTNTAELKLLPCPFCGGDARYNATESGFTAYLHVACSACGAESGHVRYRTYYNGLDSEKNPIPPEEMKVKSAAGWNRRSAAQGEPSKAEDENVEDLRKMLHDRAAVGLRKYGVTTCKSNIGLREWLQHALEETLDNAVYMRAAMRKLAQAGSAEQVSELEALHGLLDAVLEGLDRIAAPHAYLMAADTAGKKYIERAALSAPAIKESLTTAPERNSEEEMREPYYEVKLGPGHAAPNGDILRQLHKPSSARLAPERKVMTDATSEMEDMLGRIHPYAMASKEDRIDHAEERLRRAYCIQQPAPVPDQACVVWRADLMSVMYELIHKRAYFDHHTKKDAALNKQGEQTAPEGGAK